MSSRTPLYALILLLALGFLAPGTYAEEEPAAPVKPKEEKPDHEKGDGDKEGEDGDKGGDAEKSEPVIKIVEAGTDPKALRFKPTPGSKITTTAKLVVGFSMGGMGGTMDIDVVADMTIEKGAKDGEFKVSGSLTKCEMADDPNNPMAGQLKPMVDGLKGVSFEGAYSERGKWVDNPVGNLKGVPPQSADFGKMVGVIFNGILVEVPEGALGVGGSWTDDRNVEMRGTKMKSHTLYKVEKVEGGKVSLSYTDKRSGENQKMQMMGMEVTVLKATAEGSGTMTLDLALGVASAATIKLKNVQETDAMGNIESTMDGTQATKAAVAAVTGPSDDK